jgi:hypothetical protein
MFVVVMDHCRSRRLDILFSCYSRIPCMGDLGGTAANRQAILGNRGRSVTVVTAGDTMRGFEIPVMIGRCVVGPGRWHGSRLSSYGRRHKPTAPTFPTSSGMYPRRHGSASANAAATELIHRRLVNDGPTSKPFIAYKSSPSAGLRFSRLRMPKKPRAHQISTTGVSNPLQSYVLCGDAGRPGFPLMTTTKRL